MALRPYSARPGRLVLQLAADAFVVVWVVLWYRVGRLVHDAVMSLAGVGYGLESRADGVAGNLRRAGDTAAQVPLLGDELGAPLRAAAGEVAGLAASGQDAGDSVARLATPAGWVVALVPVLAVVVVWLFLRLRFARTAGAAAELATAPAGEQLLALRALANRPLRELTAVTPSPVEAWLNGDPEVVRALAALELYDTGVRSTRGASRSTPRALER